MKEFLQVLCQSGIRDQNSEALVQFNTLKAKGEQVLPVKMNAFCFVVLYIYDPVNEVANCIQAVRSIETGSLSSNANIDRNLTKEIKYLLDRKNPFVKQFRMVGKKISQGVKNVRLRLIGRRQQDGSKYNLPFENKVDALIVALGWHLEGIHVIWAHLEKKQTTLQTCTKIHQEVLFSERGDSVAGIKRCRRDLSGDGLRKPTFVRIAVDTSREMRVRRKDSIGANELIQYENVRMLRHEKAINSFDEDDLIFSTWMAFGGNTRDWAHFEKKQMRLQTCTKIHQEVLFSERGEGIAGIKRRRREISCDGVWILAMAPQHLQLSDVQRLIYNELDYEILELIERHQILYDSLTTEQKGIYETIIDACDNNRGEMFFIYGYGGTGKTFLYKTLTTALRSKKYRDELKGNFNSMSIEINKKEKLLQLEQLANLSTYHSKHFNSFCYDNDDEDYTIAVTPSLSIEEPDNSLSTGDEHLDTIPATESDEFNKSSDFSDSNDEFSATDDDSFSIDDIEYVEASSPDSELVSSEVMEIVIPEVGGLDDDILLTIKDDILRKKLLNINLLIAKIEALNDNPTPSSDFMTKSSSTSLNSLLEDTNTFYNSLPEFETFCFEVEEISSSSTTTRSDISLPEYEAFYDNHVKEISSGSTTTHSDSSLYDSFIFDLSINPFPPADRSDFYEFADELIHIISPPEYDCFFFMIEPNSGDFTMDVVEDISPIREPRVHNSLPTHPTL
nr:ATP-dependent DNA helicase PIF4-like [Tanacetum cinerariifolium]